MTHSGVDSFDRWRDNGLSESALMPQQETFFEQTSGQIHVEVLKTYDRAYAREAFQSMNESAYAHLWKSLGIEELYGRDDIPLVDSLSRHDFLWDELEEAAREDGNLCSFFVVNEVNAGSSGSIYVSPDWPSAEAFARDRILLAQ
jgi:hypothetical protein